MEAPDPLENEVTQLPEQMMAILAGKKPIHAPKILFAMIAGSLLRII